MVPFTEERPERGSRVAPREPLAVEVDSDSPRPRPYVLARCAERTGERGSRRSNRAASRGGPSCSGAAPRSVTGGAQGLRRHIRSPFGEVNRGGSLQGGPRPHSPAVARGHRATSPVRTGALFHLAFSGIAASPPYASVQAKATQGNCSACSTCWYKLMQ
ncbi:hypothetical protein STPH1_3753 [Streptomyces sp. OM5714]|nr:hypothetical protein STPH1_3753 [Streptomyces sp. OM5714]